MIGMGGGMRYAIAKSRGKIENANRIFTNAVYMVSCFAVLFVLLGLFLSGPLVKALGADCNDQREPVEYCS